MNRRYYCFSALYACLATIRLVIWPDLLFGQTCYLARLVTGPDLLFAQTFYRARLVIRLACWHLLNWGRAFAPKRKKERNRHERF